MFPFFFNDYSLLLNMQLLNMQFHRKSAITKRYIKIFIVGNIVIIKLFNMLLPLNICLVFIFPGN